MIETGRSLRLGRLLKDPNKPLFVVPLDHTVTDGPFTDARRYDALLGTLAENGADAIVVHKGRLRLLPRSQGQVSQQFPQSRRAGAAGGGTC